MRVSTVDTIDSRSVDNIFLSAEWRDLVMLNYSVHPELLSEFVPNGTELDCFNGSTFLVSLVFASCTLECWASLTVPFHSDFDEINLRFYVRRREENEYRRGVVFIREIVPKQLVATIARLAYGENYICRPMRHRISQDEIGKTTEFEWESSRKWCRVFAQASGIPQLPPKGSLQEFITEHYWGYSLRGGSRSFEYRVSHIPWRAWECTAACFDGDARPTYGQELGKILNGKPDSAFIAEGSPVCVHIGRMIA